MPGAAIVDFRIHILGLPSAGKSTFAEALSAGLGLRHHDLDPLAFHDSDWTPRADAERLEGARRLAGQPAWITEGNHLGWVDPLLAAADIVVWLDPPLRTLLLRHLRRHMRRGPRWLVARWRFLVRSYLGPPTATWEPGDAALVTRAAIAVALAPWEHKVLRCSRPPTIEEVLRGARAWREVHRRPPARAPRATPAAGLSVHDAIAQQLEVPSPATVVDLGCGSGGTLAALARSGMHLRLVGLDVQRRHLMVAGQRLGPAHGLVCADLAQPLPLGDGCADGLVCHNLLELLVDPDALMREAARILRPGGRAILSHTDFEGIVLNAPDVELSHRVCHAYADAKQDWMAWVDGQMGRKLAGLVRRSPLSLDRVAAHTLISTRLEETAHRVEEIAAVVAKKAKEGSGAVSLEDLEAWRNGLVRADELGEFFYAETAFMAVAHR